MGNLEIKSQIIPEAIDRLRTYIVKDTGRPPSDETTKPQQNDSGTD